MAKLYSKPEKRKAVKEVSTEEVAKAADPKNGTMSILVKAQMTIPTMTMKTSTGTITTWFAVMQ